MPRLYDDIGRYGAASQGEPVRARYSGRCQVCGSHYPKRTKIIDTGAGGAHPDCVFSDVESD